MKNGYWIAVAAASLLMTPRVQPRNQLKLPSFHGIAEVRASMSVEELMRTKETIEDLIAEKEMQEQSITVEAGEPGTAEA